MWPEQEMATPGRPRGRWIERSSLSTAGSDELARVGELGTVLTGEPAPGNVVVGVDL